jgi:hypothetical protein
MASAATKFSFTCPNCDKVLRASTRPPQGKKVKCPECGEAFLPDLDDEEEATGIQEKPSLKSKAAPKKDDDDPDEKPRSKKPRDDEDDDGPPKKKRRPDDDDEDEDDRSIKKKAKKKSGSSMMLWIGLGVVGGGGALLSCVLCGVGAFVWPGFLNAKGDLNAFVPPDANMVIGGNPKMLRTKAPKLEKFIREQAAFAQPGNKQNDMEDVSFNSERMLAFGNTKNLDGKMVVLFQSTSADIAKLKRNPNLGPAQVIGGHSNVHKATEEGKKNGIPSFIAFPGNNVVIGAELDEKGLIALLERGKKTAQPNAALDLGRNVQSSPFWAAISLDADAKQKLRQSLEQGGNFIPALRDAAPAVDGIKGVTFAVDITDKEDIKMEASVICKNADDAGKIKTGAQASVDALRTLLQLGMGKQAPGQPRMPATLMDDLNSITLSTKDANATASMKLASQTLQDLAALGARQRNFPIGGGGGPPPQDFPKIDAPKNFPNLMAPNLAAGQMKEGVYNFQQGMNVNFHIHAASQQGAIVELTLLQGAAGEKVVFTDNQQGQVRISQNFAIPAAGPYRVRIRNLGPGVVPNCTVFVFGN